jgi:hypothetical protein
MQHNFNVNYAGLTPREKLQILKEMGFQEASPEEHGWTCLSRQGKGIICDCLQGVTMWGAPADVKTFLGETHEQRADFAARRQPYMNEGEGQDPGPWWAHLEKTAPRYNT